MKHLNRFVFVLGITLLLFIANRAAENGRYQMVQRPYLIDTRTGQLYAPTGYNEKWQVVCGRASEAVRFQPVTNDATTKESAKMTQRGETSRQTPGDRAEVVPTRGKPSPALQAR